MAKWLIVDSAIFSVGLQHVLSARRGNELLLLGHGDASLIEGGQFLHQFVMTDQPATKSVLVDYATLPLPGASLDCVVAWQLVDRAPNYHQQIHELARVLRPSGVLIMVNQKGYDYHSAATIQMIAYHCGLVKTNCYRLNRFGCQPFSTWQQWLHFLPDVGVGYIAQYQRTDIGLTPITDLWGQLQSRSVKETSQ